MLRFLRRMHSFGDKVTLLVTFVSGLAIVVVAGALALNDYHSLRRDAIQTVQAQAQMVAMNASAPLAFGDRVNGLEALAALHTAPEVASATLFDTDGAAFAVYRRETGPSAELPPHANGLSADGAYLVLVKPIVDRGQALGRLQVVFDLEQVRARLWSTLALIAGISLAAMLGVYAVARRLQGVLIQPIKELARAARLVSQTQNYAVRAEKLGDDELGEFTDTFNQMLAQIQKQDSQLQAARAEAERASQLKDEFVATLSHELRTPMTPILGWAQILRRVGAGDAQVQQAAEVIERNARAQTQIIDDLLDMSRIISGKVRLEMQSVNLAGVIEAALATVEPTALAREVRLLALLDPAAGPVRGDPSRLQQVFWNLLSNAIKFTGKGGRVQVTLRRGDAHVQVQVTDTGQGIAAEFLPHVFERFRQADSSTTRQHGGLGLGLAIVKQLVELHGGSVRAASAGLDQGASFSVELPALVPSAFDEAAAAGAARAHAEPAVALPGVASLRGLNILVADDDADTLALVARLLEESGAVVRGVVGAAAALQALAEQPADVLISDIGMPHLDGYQLIQRVRALAPEAGGATPAIALTAFAQTADRTRALQAGYQLHVSKPVDAAELVAAVASLAEFARATQRHGDPVVR